MNTCVTSANHAFPQPGHIVIANSMAVANSTNCYTGKTTQLDSGRSVKRNYKTELCKNYKAWAEHRQGQFYCPYGEKCNYAHGERELANFANAYEMQAKGVIENPDTYMCLPCFDHVSTGAW